MHYWCFSRSSYRIHTTAFSNVALQRPHGLLGTGSLGWPPQLSHSSRALIPHYLGLPVLTRIAAATRQVYGWAGQGRAEPATVMSYLPILFPCVITLYFNSVSWVSCAKCHIRMQHCWKKRGGKEDEKTKSNKQNTHLFIFSRLSATAPRKFWGKKEEV